MKKLLLCLGVLAVVMFQLAASAQAKTTLVQTSDPGFLNQGIGTLLNGSSPAFPPPGGGDPSLDFGPAEEPNLSTAASVLGGWLDHPVPHLNTPQWSTTKVTVPSTWAVQTEIAFIYEFDSGGIKNLVGEFGVDNGIFVWLDGVFKGGALRPGGVDLGEHTFNLGDLTSGKHFLQVLLEDHGATNGFAVLIQADEVLPAPPGDTVPQPMTLMLVGFGVLGLKLARRRLAG